MAFKHDLSEGREVEKEFAVKLLKRNPHSIEFAPNCKFKDWDIKAIFEKDGVETQKTFEIKNDMVSERTGNVGFEYACNGEPSGIYASKADYIVYRLGNKFYYVDRARLLIRLSTVDKQNVVGGDNNKSAMFLVKKELFSNLTREL